MCIIIYKPKDIVLPKETYENCFNNNSDGAGFVSYDETNGLNLKKGFFSFNDFWEAFQQDENKKALVHFRIKTSGLIDANNCHPFWIKEQELAFVHNGMISIPTPEKDFSDTWHFNTVILKELREKAGPDFLMSKGICTLLHSFVGLYNKLAFMDQQGEAWIMNKSQGSQTDDGVWYSNESYKCKKTYPIVTAQNSEFTYETKAERKARLKREANQARDTSYNGGSQFKPGDFAELTWAFETLEKGTYVEIAALAQQGVWCTVYGIIGSDDTATQTKLIPHSYLKKVVIN